MAGYQREKRSNIVRTATVLLPYFMGCLAFGAGFGARAQEVPQQLRLAPGDIEFPAPAGGQTGTSGVGALQVKVLSGDPKKPGLYTLIVKAGPNITIKPHAHPDNRVSVVVAGTFYFGTATSRTEQLKALPRSFYTEPPRETTSL